MCIFPQKRFRLVYVFVGILLLEAAIFSCHFAWGAWVGINVQEYTSPKSLVKGLQVVEVAPGSPAAKADVQAGDILLSANNYPLDQKKRLRDICAVLHPGDELKLVISRNGKQGVRVLYVEEEPQKTKLLQEGQAFLADKHYEEAVQRLGLAIEIDPLFALAYVYRSSAYKELNIDGAAQKDADIAAQIYLQRGRELADNGNHVVALFEFEHGARLDTKYRSQLYYYKAISREELGQYQLAANDYTETIKRAPQTAKAYLRRGLLYTFKLHDKNLARQDLEQAIVLDSGGKAGQYAREILQKSDALRPKTEKRSTTFHVIFIDDDFDTENGGNGLLNYANFAHWTVGSGTVDLIGNGFWDIFPDNGLYVDLDGSTREAGTLISKESFDLYPGRYLLSFHLAGNPFRGPDTVIVRLGSVFQQVYILQHKDPFQKVEQIIPLKTRAKAKLIFQHEGGDNHGLILDRVKFVQIVEK